MPRLVMGGAGLLSGLALAQDTLVEADFETCRNFNFERIRVSQPTKILADGSVGGFGDYYC